MGRGDTIPIEYVMTGAKGESVSFVLWISGLSPKLHTLQTETARSVPAFGMERKFSVYYRRKIWTVTDREVQL